MFRSGCLKLHFQHVIYQINLNNGPIRVTECPFTWPFGNNFFTFFFVFISDKIFSTLLCSIYHFKQVKNCLGDIDYRGPNELALSHIDGFRLSERYNFMIEKLVMSHNMLKWFFIASPKSAQSCTKY